MTSPRRLGVLGGTFDPIHNGHVFAAEAAANAFALDQVLLVPCGQPPHKDPSGITPAEHRYAMCVLAAESDPRLAASRIEVDRPGPSYAYDTVVRLLQQYGLPDLYYITGTDSFALIGTWHRYMELLRLCSFVVVRRPGAASGYGPADAVGGSRVHYLDIPGLEVSASDVRTRIRRGQSVHSLVPARVERYIRDQGLYR